MRKKPLSNCKPKAAPRVLFVKVYFLVRRGIFRTKESTLEQEEISNGRRKESLQDAEKGTEWTLKGDQQDPPLLEAEKGGNISVGRYRALGKEREDPEMYSRANCFV